MEKSERYVIVCDESTRHGKNYSYFFGGALVKESEYQKVNEVLKVYSESKGLGEVKRTKITLTNYRNYIELLDLFFTYVQSSKVRARVMFAKNEELDVIPSSLDETYCKFYYLFIRYAFSIFYARQDIQLRLIFDDLPETREACTKFKGYLVENLNAIYIPGRNHVRLIEKDIEEVDSKKHMVLQCMDVVMGMIDFCLNSTSEERESKRGQAKMYVCKHIFAKIREIHPEFIVDITTPPLYSYKGWVDSYKHFTYKKGKNKTPVVPT